MRRSPRRGPAIRMVYPPSSYFPEQLALATKVSAALPGDQTFYFCEPPGRRPCPS